MEPPIEIVLRRRHMVRCIVRGLSAALVILSIMPMLVQVLDNIPYGWQSMLDRPFYAFRYPFPWSATLLAAAIAIFLLDQRLARWIVPMPEAKCPNCSYPLHKLTQPLCPECGCAVPASFISKKAKVQ